MKEVVDCGKLVVLSHGVAGMAVVEEFARGCKSVGLEGRWG